MVMCLDIKKKKKKESFWLSRLERVKQKCHKNLLSPACFSGLCIFFFSLFGFLHSRTVSGEPGHIHKQRYARARFPRFCFLFAFFLSPLPYGTLKPVFRTFSCLSFPWIPHGNSFFLSLSLFSCIFPSNSYFVFFSLELFFRFFSSSVDQSTKKNFFACNFFVFNFY